MHTWPVPGSSLQDEYRDFLVWRPPTEHTPVPTLHGGIDFALGDNKPHVVRAAAPGRVVASSTKTSYSPGLLVIAGNTIYQGRVITLYLVYGHMSPTSISAFPVGVEVASGEFLGRYASRQEINKFANENKTNPDMACHLHFEVRKTLAGQLGKNKILSNFDPISFLAYGKLIQGRVKRERYPVQGW